MAVVAPTFVDMHLSIKRTVRAKGPRTMRGIAVPVYQESNHFFRNFTWQMFAYIPLDGHVAISRPIAGQGDEVSVSSADPLLTLSPSKIRFGILGRSEWVVVGSQY